MRAESYAQGKMWILTNDGHRCELPSPEYIIPLDNAELKVNVSNEQFHLFCEMEREHKIYQSIFSSPLREKVCTDFHMQYISTAISLGVSDEHIMRVLNHIDNIETMFWRMLTDDASYPLEHLKYFDVERILARSKEVTEFTRTLAACFGEVTSCPEILRYAPYFTNLHTLKIFYERDCYSDLISLPTVKTIHIDGSLLKHLKEKRGLQQLVIVKGRNPMDSQSLVTVKENNPQCVVV